MTRIHVQSIGRKGRQFFAGLVAASTMGWAADVGAYDYTYDHSAGINYPKPVYDSITPGITKVHCPAQLIYWSGSERCATNVAEGFPEEQRHVKDLSRGYPKGRAKLHCRPNGTWGVFPGALCFSSGAVPLTTLQEDVALGLYNLAMAGYSGGIGNEQAVLEYADDPYKIPYAGPFVGPIYNNPIGYINGWIATVNGLVNPVVATALATVFTVERLALDEVARQSDGACGTTPSALSTDADCQIRYWIGLYSGVYEKQTDGLCTNPNDTTDADCLKAKIDDGVDTAFSTLQPWIDAASDAFEQNSDGQCLESPSPTSADIDCQQVYWIDYLSSQLSEVAPNDTDGDGYSDEVEGSFNSDPNNAESTPVTKVTG